ncbi:hypothetical protein P9C02_19855 [Bacillus paralicheniformis]|uniref:hypothetical protein n=1 Tax=Bacillus paralicheniformis TaxID=1648923 RepID=UPI002DBC4094|nr:hypothetical protein [Bacillus paralicheniformis]MEC1192713.1 hypothetical protein [Bacillus paralicheniformis]MEC1281999.1 hypothetical protein [Bacillus paralicheniformis]MEC1300118.1 hypothetical protein [Bacillus paralicheniformis]
MLNNVTDGGTATSYIAQFVPAKGGEGKEFIETELYFKSEYSIEVSQRMVHKDFHWLVDTAPQQHSIKI